MTERCELAKIGDGKRGRPLFALVFQNEFELVHSSRDRFSHRRAVPQRRVDEFLGEPRHALRVLWIDQQHTLDL